MKALELSGQSFGRLKVISRATEGRKAKWNCVCECGKTKIVRADHLRAGAIKSCGCLSNEMTIARSTTHGGCGTTEYTSWAKMRERCYDRNNNEFHRYGARGVTVCDRWRQSFANFIQDMGKKPSPKHSIDRINPFGNYEPSNCKWSTPLEQAHNRRDTYAQAS